MNESDIEAAQQRLVELRARFVVSLRERVERLDERVRAASEGADGALADALVVAHRLAGTAGSFGYPEAGEAAAALETVLRRIADGAEPRAWDEARAALARVRAATPTSA